MIKVWTDSQEAGMLDRSGDKGQLGLTLQRLLPRALFPATMPICLSSWDISFRIAANLRNESSSKACFVTLIRVGIVHVWKRPLPQSCREQRLGNPWASCN